jgi:hypothetical protein
MQGDHLDKPPHSWHIAPYTEAPLAQEAVIMRLALLSLFFGAIGTSGLAYAQAEAIDEVPPDVPPSASAPAPAPAPVPAVRRPPQRRVYVDGAYPGHPVYPPPAAARPAYPHQYQPGGYYSYPAYPTYPAYPGPGYYAPPQGYGYPRPGYSVAPQQYARPAHQGPLTCQLCRKPDRRGPVLGLGVRYSALGVRQQINGRNVVLKGWGAVLRLRGRGHLAFELSLDFLGGNFPASGQGQASGGSGGGGSAPPSGGVEPDGSPTPRPGPAADGAYFRVGDVGRQSRVISATLMAYLLRNTRSRIFNLYVLAGGGYISSTLGLTNQYGRRVRQNFGEYEGHVGVGAELKFRWFAIDANVRAIGMLRNNRSAPAAYYANVDGAPISPRSFGYQGTISGLLWF